MIRVDALCTVRVIAFLKVKILFKIQGTDADLERMDRGKLSGKY